MTEELLLDPSEIRRTQDWRFGCEDEEEWLRWRATFARLGQVQAVSIGRDKDGYFLKAGHRRHRACTELGIKVRAALVEGNATLIAVVENEGRRRWRPAELATALAELRPLYASGAELAADAGLSPQHVNNLIRIKKKLHPDLWQVFLRYGEGLDWVRMAEIAAMPQDKQVEEWNRSRRTEPTGIKRRRVPSRRVLSQQLRRLEGPDREGPYWDGWADCLRSLLGDGKKGVEG